MLQNTWDFNGFIVLLQHWIDHTDLVDFIWKHVKKIICLWALFTSAKHPHNICKFYFHFTIILRSLFWDQVWKDKFGIFLIKLFWYIMKWGSIATLCYCDMNWQCFLMDDEKLSIFFSTTGNRSESGYLCSACIDPLSSSGVQKHI